MRIIGFNFKKISVERKKEIKGRLQIKSNIDIKNIEKEELNIVKEGQVLKFQFGFSINYEPDFAELIFEGFVLAILDAKQAKEVLKKWKNKKISDDFRVPLFNFILTKCNLKALQFEEEFNLLPHIPLPRIQQQQQANYTG